MTILNTFWAEMARLENKHRCEQTAKDRSRIEDEFPSKRSRIKTTAEIRKEIVQELGSLSNRFIFKQNQQN